MGFHFLWQILWSKQWPSDGFRTDIGVDGLSQQLSCIAGTDRAQVNCITSAYRKSALSLSTWPAANQLIIIIQGFLCGSLNACSLLTQRLIYLRCTALRKFQVIWVSLHPLIITLLAHYMLAISPQESIGKAMVRGLAPFLRSLTSLSSPGYLFWL